MLRAVHLQIARLLNCVDRTGAGSNAAQAVGEAENHRRGIENRSGSEGGGLGIQMTGG